MSRRLRRWLAAIRLTGVSSSRPVLRRGPVRRCLLGWSTAAPHPHIGRTRTIDRAHVRSPISPGSNHRSAGYYTAGREAHRCSRRADFQRCPALSTAIDPVCRFLSDDSENSDSRRAETVEGAEGKIKADGTTLGHRAKTSWSAHWVRRRRAAPSKRCCSAAPWQNANIRAAFRGTTRSLVVLLD